MTELISKAGFLVGLQCLATYTMSREGEVDDDDILNDMLKECDAILKIWKKAFKGFKTLPPGLERKDLPSSWIPGHQCLNDSSVFPFALRLLEISAGGCEGAEI